MGGSTVGNIISPIARVGADTFTFGTNEALGNPAGNLTSKLTNAGPGSLGSGSIYGNLFGSPGNPSPYVSGPFSLDPNQVAHDQNAITGLGQSQYNQTLSGIDNNATAQNQAAANFFQASLPNIAENAQAAHLYDSSGYGQEVARQQAALANQVASQTAGQKLQALQGLQGTQTAGLQRGLSMEDFINQANVAKTIGAQMAPQPPSSKAQTGTALQGVGAVATPLATYAAGK